MTELCSKECSCRKCIAACSIKPGWFMPGEAEEAAKLLGLSLEEFFSVYLGVDYWEAELTEEYDIYVLAPATLRGNPGEVYPLSPYGKCRLLDDIGRCKIYGAHPYECRKYIHTDDYAESNRRHKIVRDAWKKRQDQIEELFGRPPSTTDKGDW